MATMNEEDAALTIKVKYRHNAQRIRIARTPSPANLLSALESIVRLKFGVPADHSVELRYEDSDGDTVTLTSGHELDELCADGKKFVCELFTLPNTLALRNGARDAAHAAHDEDAVAPAVSASTPAAADLSLSAAPTASTSAAANTANAAASAPTAALRKKQSANRMSGGGAAATASKPKAPNGSVDVKHTTAPIPVPTVASAKDAVTVTTVSSSPSSSASSIGFHPPSPSHSAVPTSSRVTATSAASTATTAASPADAGPLKFGAVLKPFGACPFDLACTQLTDPTHTERWYHSRVSNPVCGASVDWKCELLKCSNELHCTAQRHACPFGRACPQLDDIQHAVRWTHSNTALLPYVPQPITQIIPPPLLRAAYEAGAPYRLPPAPIPAASAANHDASHPQHSPPSPSQPPQPSPPSHTPSPSQLPRPNSEKAAAHTSTAKAQPSAAAPPNPSASKPPPSGATAAASHKQPTASAAVRAK